MEKFEESETDLSPPPPLERSAERVTLETIAVRAKEEDAPTLEPVASSATGRPQIRFEFDLNLDLDENGDVATVAHHKEVKEEEEEQESESEQQKPPPSWPPTLSVDIPQLGVGHLQDRHTTMHPDEDDYDCEDDEDG